MKNKFPGTCHCGAKIPAQAGQAIRVAGRWGVVCSLHAFSREPEYRGTGEPCDAVRDAYLEIGGI